MNCIHEYNFQLCCIKPKTEGEMYMIDVKIIPDFEGKKEEAKKWADERYQNWTDRLLTKEEKAEIADYINDKEAAQKLNTYLEDIRGNTPDNSDYKEYIDRLDKGLKKEKTTHVMYVYPRVSEEFFGHELGSFRTGGTINQDKFKEFKGKFIENKGILKENGYLEVSLSGESPNLAQEPCFYMRVKVPVGSHGGYTGGLQGGKDGTHDFLLDRGYGLQFNDAKIITQKGREYIKVEAELLTKEKLDQKINDYSKKLNEELLNADIITIEEHPLVKINFNGRFLNENYKTSKEIIEAMKRLPTDFLELLNLRAKDIATANGLSESINIRIIDDYIDGSETLEGKHEQSGEHETYVSLRAAKNPVQTALHEIGHALDDMLFDHISSEKDFGDLFQIEKENFPDDWYGRKDQEEYFAECFALYYYPNEIINAELKKRAPKTYEFIKNLESKLSQIEWRNKLYLKNHFHAKIDLNLHNSTCNIYYNKSK